MCENDIGKSIYNLAVELFPICRSITGNGVRETLKIIRHEVSDLNISEVASGTRCFDWTIPPEWNIKEAYLINPDGEKIVDFSKNNLHVMGYSEPVNKTIPLEELQEHLYSLPDMPDAIPYVTSYYERRWGFCITHQLRENLQKGNYKIYIDSTLEPGQLTYGEIVIPGKSKKEIFLSTYICHPSLANNEISGPVVTTYLAKWLLGLRQREYTYRIVLVPETIGSIAYLSEKYEHLKNNVVAGFCITSIGDDNAYSYVESKYGDTVSDRIARHVLNHIAPNYKSYPFVQGGGDERQYCSPGIDLPLVTVMRSKHYEYPEYHTSKDDLDFISPAGLYGGYNVLKYCLLCLEHNEVLQNTFLCQPHLSKYGLYPTVSIKREKADFRIIKNLLSYTDGNNDLLSIAEILGIKMWDLFAIVDQLKGKELLEGTS